MAMLSGMVFAKNIGVQNIVVEGDCLGVVAAVGMSGEDLYALGNIMEDIRRGVGWFNSCAFGHIKRTANGVAHEIAGYAHSVPSEVFWLEDLPSCFQVVLAFDSPPAGE
uniref:RNase H type-1 domain-containing protein n=1 Tax=Davidia involucrata TaxID=16924 RepID=A0A5B7C5K4_DAVIN